MNTTAKVYSEYALIETKIKELTNQKDSLRVKILEDMVDKGEEKIETDVGSFTVTMLKTWTYTPKDKELEEAYKARKAKEESTGDASYVEKPSLRFTGIKL
jgi:hypothetical protein